MHRLPGDTEKEVKNHPNFSNPPRGLGFRVVTPYGDITKKMTQHCSGDYGLAS